MSQEQSIKEIWYKIAFYELKKMLQNGLITQEEYEKIKILNIGTYAPEFSKVYV